MIYGEFALTIAWYWSTQTPQHFVRRFLGDEQAEKGQANSITVTLHKYVIFSFNIKTPDFLQHCKHIILLGLGELMNLKSFSASKWQPLCFLDDSEGKKCLS